MAYQRTWTKEEILEMWPQAKGELQGFQRHLERNAGITASQLGMALQLADEEFSRLKGSPNPYQDLIDKVCSALKEDFVRFITTGEGTNVYLSHVDHCPKCQRSIEEVIKRQATAFENLARSLRDKSSRK